MWRCCWRGGWRGRGVVKRAQSSRESQQGDGSQHIHAARARWTPSQADCTKKNKTKQLFISTFYIFQEEQREEGAVSFLLPPTSQKISLSCCSLTPPLGSGENSRLRGRKTGSGAITNANVSSDPGGDKEQR